MDACEKKCRKFNASQIPCRLYTVLIILHAHQELGHFTNSLMQQRWSIPQLTSSSLGYTESLSKASLCHALYMYAFSRLIAAPYLIFRHEKLLIIEATQIAFELHWKNWECHWLVFIIPDFEKKEKNIWIYWTDMLMYGSLS